MRKGLFTLLSLVCAGLIWAAPAPANAADKPFYMRLPPLYFNEL